MNVLYSCCISDPWLQVSQQLKQKHGLIPVYWIGWSSDSKDVVHSSFPNCVYHNITEAWKGVFPILKEDIETPTLCGKLMGQYLREELLALKMMDRLDPSGYDFSFNERQKFFRYLVRSWLTIIRNRNIEFVISPSIPHRVFDYALYLACKIDKVYFLSFKMTVWPGRIIPLTDIERLPKFKSYSEIQNIEAVSEYIGKVRSDYKKAEPSYMKNQKRTKDYGTLHAIKDKIKPTKLFSIFDKTESYWKQQGIEYRNVEISKTKKQLILAKGRAYKKALKRTYDNLSVLPDLTKKFCFVALHYQPEETSSPSGGIYVDQKLMIETLLKYLPKDVLLYVKEHTSQFHPIMEGQTGRSNSFYTDLIKFNRVHLIRTSISSFELIDKALCSATLTGTVGLESVIRGTPVFVFGAAWYESLSGVVKVTDKTYSENWLQSIQEERSHIIEEQTKLELNTIYLNTISAYHYGRYKERSNISQEEAVKNLVEVIKGNIPS